MLEALLEIFGEFLIQALGEMLIEFGFHWLGTPPSKKPNPWLAAAGYIFFGAVLGDLSLFIFPTHLVTGNVFRWINLLVTPVGVGFLMCALGAWRLRRGQSLIRIDRFAYGYLFALSIALVRFWFAR